MNHPHLIPYCTTTSAIGKLDFSDKTPYTEKACKPHIYNAGNWYNFAAATAGSDNHAIILDTETPNSICPKGWKLPSDSGNKSYQNLIYNIYQITDGPSGSVDANLINNSAMVFARFGHYDNLRGSINNRGASGSYWSSTLSNSTLSYRLYFDGGRFSPQDPEEKYNGYSIRCVSR